MISAATNASKTSEEINKLFRENIRLVPYTYSKLSHCAKVYFEYDELISAGRLGLFKACRNYDGSKASFAAYAIPAIHNEMARVIRDANAKHRIPISAMCSLEQPISEDNNLMIGDTISDNGNTIKYKELLIDIENFSQTLSDKYKIVFKAMIDCNKQSDTAKILGITQSAVSRIMTKIQNKFKEYYYGKII